MNDQLDAQKQLLAPGTRVHICNDTLQAFYGRYGTVLNVHTCSRDGHIICVNVQMDELPPGEAAASFYPDQLDVLE